MSVLLPQADERTYAWMARKRRSIVVARIETQLANSRRRRARRALVNLADLEVLIRER